MIKYIGWWVSAIALVVLSGCGEGETAVESAEVSRPVPMMVVPLSDRTSSVRFPGRVRAAQRADLTFNVPGQLVELPVEEGQLIEKGALVARLDDANYKTQMRSALARYNKERTDYERFNSLWQRSQAIAKSEVDKQRTAMDVAQADYALTKKDFDDTRLLAPFSGVVTKRHVENYSNVQDKEPIVGLQDLNNLEIVINVPERIVRHTAKQVAGNAVFADRPEQLLPVSLKSFSSDSDSQTQTYEVVVTLDPGYDITILPGMSVDVIPQEAMGDLTAAQVMVPLKAIYSSADDTTGVWVFDPETSRVSLQKVQLGDVLGTNVVVRSGLVGGEQIVTAGVSQLRDSMLVRSL